LKPNKKSRMKVKNENTQGEINPSKLDRVEIQPDQAGVEHTKGHEPFDFKRQDEMPNLDES
jgi:hypothetical protein